MYTEVSSKFKNHKVLLENGMLYKYTPGEKGGIIFGLSNLTHCFDHKDVKKVTGNTGTENYEKYIKLKIKEIQPKSSKHFADELNKICGREYFSEFVE